MCQALCQGQRDKTDAITSLGELLFTRPGNQLWHNPSNNQHLKPHWFQVISDFTFISKNRQYPFEIFIVKPGRAACSTPPCQGQGSTSLQMFIPSVGNHVSVCVLFVTLALAQWSWTCRVFLPSLKPWDNLHKPPPPVSLRSHFLHQTLLNHLTSSLLLTDRRG